MKNPETETNSILLIGIGNSGRRDDGLGWQFAEEASLLIPEGIDYEFRYQLQIEDAMLVSRYKTVIFADATYENTDEGFSIRKCLPASHYFYSSHVQSPETILYLCDEIYRKKPQAFTIAITGYEWELKSGISNKATDNLEKALAAWMHDLYPSLDNEQDKQQTAKQAF